MPPPIERGIVLMDDESVADAICRLTKLMRMLDSTLEESFSDDYRLSLQLKSLEFEVIIKDSFITLCAIPPISNDLFEKVIERIDHHAGHVKSLLSEMREGCIDHEKELD